MQPPDPQTTNPAASTPPLVDAGGAADGGPPTDSALGHGVPSAPVFDALPLARLIPQDLHSVMDYADAAIAGSGAWMASCPRVLALPFALGYWKTAPRVALAHVTVGSGTIIAALLTDYRAYRGRGATRGTV